MPAGKKPTSLLFRILDALDQMSIFIRNFSSKFSPLPMNMLLTEEPLARLYLCSIVPVKPNVIIDLISLVSNSTSPTVAGLAMMALSTIKPDPSIFSILTTIMLDAPMGGRKQTFLMLIIVEYYMKNGPEVRKQVAKSNEMNAIIGLLNDFMSSKIKLTKEFKGACIIFMDYFFVKSSPILNVQGIIKSIVSYPPAVQTAIMSLHIKILKKQPSEMYFFVPPKLDTVTAPGITNYIEQLNNVIPVQLSVKEDAAPILGILPWEKTALFSQLFDETKVFFLLPEDK